MKKHSKPIFILLASFSMLLNGCSCAPRRTDDLSKAPKWQEQMYFDYTKAYPSQGFIISDLWSNNNEVTDPFGSTWNENQVTGSHEDGLLLSVNKTDDMSLIRDTQGKQRSDFEPYLSAEVKTANSYKYGFYGITMKPSPVSGIVSTFFLYTGPSENNPHDEIDFEFTGKDTRRVQLNYYNGWDVTHEFWLDLPFDASEDFHQYGIYWGEKEICWYIDYEPVFRVANIKAPSHECKVFTSCWKVTQYNDDFTAWAGKIDDKDLPATAQYKNMTICDLDGNPINPRPKGSPYDICPEEDELEAAPVKMESKSAEYSVSEDEANNSFDVTYTDLAAKTYKNIQFQLKEKELKDYKWLAMRLKNEAETSSKIRITINKDSGSDMLELSKIWVDGKEGVGTISDKIYSYVTVPANKTIDVALHFYGVNAKRIYLMLDSTSRGDDEPSLKSGHVVIDNFRVGGVQDYKGDDTGDVPQEIYPGGGSTPDPDPQPQGEDPLKDYTQKSVTMEYTNGDGFQFVNNTDGSVTVTYENVKATSPIVVNNWADIKANAGGKVVGWKLNIQNLNNRTSNLCMYTKSASDAKTMDSSKSYATGNAAFTRSGGTGEYFTLSANGTGTIQVAFDGETTTKLRLLVDNTSSTVENGSVKILNATIYVDENGSVTPPTPQPGGEYGLIDTMYAFNNLDNEKATYTATVTEEGTRVTFTTKDNASGNYEPFQTNNVASFNLVDPKYTLIEVTNEDDKELFLSVIYRVSSGADGGSAGEVVSSTLGTTTYEKYSSGNGAYFHIGAGDTAVLKVTLTGAPTKVRLIPGCKATVSTSGQFLIKSWKTYHQISA